MKTDKIHVNHKGDGLEDVLKEAEKFASYEKFSSKEAMHLRLLCEETIGLIKEITGEYEAFFWMDDEKKVSIYLDIMTYMDRAKRRELLSVSSTGKNFLAKGIMGKIKEVIDYTLLADDPTSPDYNTILQMGLNTIPYDIQAANPAAGYQIWSLSQYRDQIGEHRDDSEETDDAWDELEKSIVANLAEDVSIGIREDTVKVAITMK